MATEDERCTEDEVEGVAESRGRFAAGGLSRTREAGGDAEGVIADLDAIADVVDVETRISRG